jgi:hypothetical protein
MMSIFSSQFDRARPFADAYAGGSQDPDWRTPAAATALVGAGLVGLTAAAALTDGSAADPAAAGEATAPEAFEGAGETGAATWDAGWDEGWDTGWGEGYAGDACAPEADGAAWLDRGDYTDAGVGGDNDFFYFIDGDSSLAIG